MSGLIGNATNDYKSTTDDVLGSNFYEPNFVSINNTRSGEPLLEADDHATSSRERVR